eukprot:Sspe_Gene.63648::Locus_36739_Transcript_1_1_Confidence_1.000_Length_414::g.63648::m.63648
MGDVTAAKFMDVVQTKFSSQLCSLDSARVVELHKRWGCGKGADQAFFMAVAGLLDGVNGCKRKSDGSMVYCFRCETCAHLEEETNTQPNPCVKCKQRCTVALRFHK